MNNVFTAKLLQNLNNKKGNKGFTLIELLVVVIIIGVLAAVALPNLLGQVGKARETEAKATIGSMNKTQKAYHFERRTFAPAGTDVTLTNNPLGIVIVPKYYTYAVATSDDDNATATAAAIDAATDGLRLYAGGIAHAAGAYDESLCQSDTIGGAATASAAGGGAGCSDGTEIEQATVAPTP